MNREILFRAQQADTKEWVYGYPVFDFADCNLKRNGKCACEHSGELMCFYGWIDELHEYGEIDVIPETICQYTGFSDCNKAKVFEGDILKGREKLYIVEFDSSFGAFTVRSNAKGSLRCFFGKTESKYMKVAGNVFDNPEFLNQ